MTSILPLRAEGLGYAPAQLTGVDLAIAAGPPTLVIGPNGAGKSVLLRLLHGLLRPTEGSVAWAADLPRRQAMVFQRPVLLRRSVLANARYGLRLAGVGGAEATARARAALDAVGLLPLADRPARALSGGEGQRLALARAAALRPEVLFLDEPCASLDPAAARAVEDIVARLAGAGTKVVMTTHDLAQARRLAGEVAFLHAGRLNAHGPSPAFFDHPATPEAAAFLRGELHW
ncbi:ATP-binding cassette domain-containing protein [Roseococcus sp. DSY-14]|uniref:ATP-binding cassette domain-containing protein n=1 Tax=Roseococcus sp. DSY-14 TaxID=3369650 RepID=UPI00387B0186